MAYREVQRGKGYHINCLKLLAATLAVKLFLKDQVNNCVNRQSDSSHLYEQPRQYSLTLSDYLGERPLDVVPGKRNTALGTISPRGGEC